MRSSCAPANYAENTATINQQKRKLSRQHDVLLNLKGKYSRSDSKFCDENSKLTEEYKRITEHFKDMQVCDLGAAIPVWSVSACQLWSWARWPASGPAELYLEDHAH